MLVEDSDEVRAVLERILRHAGYDVASFARPALALSSRGSRSTLASPCS